MSLADLVPVAVACDFRSQPREEPWRRWRRKPEVRKHLTTYKREWRARLRTQGRKPT